MLVHCKMDPLTVKKNQLRTVYPENAGFQGARMT